MTYAMYSACIMDTWLWVDVACGVASCIASVLEGRKIIWASAVAVLRGILRVHPSAPFEFDDGGTQGILACLAYGLAVGSASNTPKTVADKLGCGVTRILCAMFGVYLVAGVVQTIYRRMTMMSAEDRNVILSLIASEAAISSDESLPPCIRSVIPNTSLNLSQLSKRLGTTEWKAKTRLQVKITIYRNIYDWSLNSIEVTDGYGLVSEEEGRHSTIYTGRLGDLIEKHPGLLFLPMLFKHR